MKHVENWDEVKERYEQWWTGKLKNGPLLKIHAPAAKPPAERVQINTPKDMKERWLDAQYRTASYCANLPFGAYLGDAFPMYWPNFGPGCSATYVGSEPSFAPDTVWFLPLQVPTLEDIEPYLKFNPENYWWKLLCEHIQVALRASNGDFIVGHTDMGGAMDILASLRGTQNLLFDLLERPDVVKKIEAKIIDLWFIFYDEQHKLMRQAGQDGTSAWMGLWAQKTWYPLQCDFSAMISPENFSEFVVPNLRRQCQWLTHSVYHWDGPGEIPHLDHLLSIEELDAIQWTPGAGNPNVDEEVWLPLYKRITESGKGLVLLGARADRIEWLMSKLPAERLFISTSCGTEAEARELMRKVF